MKLDESEFDKLISTIPNDAEISFLAAAGEYRIGKSFILSGMIDPIQHYCEFGDLNDFNETLYRFDRKGKNGFHYASGSDSVTKGIFVLSPPFIHYKNSKKIALFLMDTQGINAADTDMSFEQILLAITSYISSFILYNVKKHILPKQLEGLLFFTLASKIPSNLKDVMNDDFNLPTLILLARDFSFTKKKEYCKREEASDYYEKIICNRSSELQVYIFKNIELFSQNRRLL